MGILINILNKGSAVSSFFDDSFGDNIHWFCSLVRNNDGLDRVKLVNGFAVQDVLIEIKNSLWLFCSRLSPLTTVRRKSLFYFFLVQRIEELVCFLTLKGWWFWFKRQFLQQLHLFLLSFHFLFLQQLLVFLSLLDLILQWRWASHFNLFIIEITIKII